MVDSRLKRFLLYQLIICFFAFSIDPAIAIQAEQIKQFKTEYKVKQAGFKIANTLFSLSKISDSLYVYKSYAVPAGILSWLKHTQVNETSHWMIQDEIILPINYQYEMLNSRKIKEYSAIFNWQDNKVVVDKGNRLTTIDIEKGTLDNLSLQIAIMSDLRQGKENLEYKVLDRRRVRTYKFKKVGEEKIKTPLGKFRTIKIKSVLVKKKKRITTFWCAPALDYLPVKITYKNKNSPKYTMTLYAVDGLGPQTTEK